jgi:molybdenum cofactor cytidylyltransferase
MNIIHDCKFNAPVREPQVFLKRSLIECIPDRMLDRNCKNTLNLTKSQAEGKGIMVSAILLGAGESKRMKVNKLSLPWGRETVFEHCFNTLLRSKAGEIIVVLNKQNEEMKDRFEKMSASTTKKVKVTVNPRYKRGMSTSIHKGLQVMDPRSEGILISLGDQPLLRTRTINVLLRAFQQRKGEIIVPSFRGMNGHPVIFDRRYKKELLKLRGDTGGKPILLKYPKQIKTISVKSEGVIKDIDTRADYQKALRMRRGRDEKRNSDKIE